jgi:hypothetical protein
MTNDDLLNAQAEAHRVDLELQALDKKKEAASAQVEELKALVLALGKLKLDVSLTICCFSFVVWTFLLKEVSYLDWGCFPFRELPEGPVRCSSSSARCC